MRNEWYRLFKSDILYIVCLISVIFTMITSFHYYTNKFEPGFFTVSDIEVYETVEDLDGLIADITYDISQLDKNSYDYSKRLKELESKKSIYSFLKDNYIDYNDLYEFLAINGYESDALSYFKWIGNMIYILLIVISIIIGSYMLNQDFLLKTQINLYTSKYSRKQLYFNKFLTYISLIVFLYIIMSLIGILFGTDYTFTKQYLLLVGENVSSMKSLNYILLMFLTNLIDILFIGTTIYMISCMFKNIFASVAMNTLLIAVFGFVVPWYLGNVNILFLIQPSIDWYSINVSISKLIYIVLIKIGIISILTFSSLRVFRRRNLI